MIGVWYQPASALPRWRSLGINTAVGVLLEPQVTAADYVNWAHAQGLYVVGKAAEADAWEQVDEPDGAGATDADMVVFQYSTWKAMPGGAQRPVFLSLDGWRTQFGKPEEYVRYCQGADWISFDYYVINRGEGPEAIKKLGERIDQLKAWAAPSTGSGQAGKRIIAFIEVSDQDLRVTDWAKDTRWGPALAPKMRGPTADEVEAEVKVCIAHGASGIVYFPQKIGRNWEAHDVMPAEVAARIAVINAKLSSAPVPATQPVPTPATLPTPTPATVPSVPPVVVAPPPPIVATTQMAVPPPALPTRTRVMVDANVPPIYLPIYDAKGNVLRMARETLAHDFLVARGVEECWVLYNGTFNRSVWWADCKDLADFAANGMKIPDAVRCDPPTRQACVALGKLARNPARFGSTARPHCPLFIDIEGAASLTCFTGYDLAVRKAYLRNWLNTLEWLRDGAGPEQEISIYGDVTFRVIADAHGDDDDDELRALAKQLAERLSVAGIGIYSWDYQAENRAGRLMFDLIDIERTIRRERPDCVATKTAFINPCYQIYWPQNLDADAAALNGKPVPFDTWCQEVDWLVAHGYQIVIWMGWGDPEPVAAHLTYAAQYGLTPKGEAAKWIAKASSN